MIRMKPPRIPDQPPDVLREPGLRKLLAACETGKTLKDRRDAAILRFFIDTGARLAEVSGIRYDPRDAAVTDIDLDRGLAKLAGKGGRTRAVSIGDKSVRAIDRYPRLRGKHANATVPWLWVGRSGRFTESGVGQMVREPGRQAGLGSSIHRAVSLIRVRSATLTPREVLDEALPGAATIGRRVRRQRLPIHGRASHRSPPWSRPRSRIQRGDTMTRSSTDRCTRLSPRDANTVHSVNAGIACS